MKFHQANLLSIKTVQEKMNQPHTSGFLLTSIGGEDQCRVVRMLLRMMIDK